MTFASTSDNAAHGYNLTFAFPMILLIVVVGTLYLIYRRPHKVPGHGELRSTGTRAAGGPAPEPDAARAAATAGGFSTAAGGGTTESAAEPIGAHQAASTDQEPDNAPQDKDEAAAEPPSAPPPATTDPSAEDEANE